MSRTLSNVLTIGAGIVLTAIGNPLGPILLAAGASSTINSLLAPSLPKAEQTQTSIKLPTPTRVIANGSRRLYGAYLFYGSGTTGNAVDVLAFTDSRMGTVLQLYLNDDKVTIGAGGIVNPGTDERYKDGKLRLGYNVGLPTETAFSYVIGELPGIWTTAHRGDGIATGFLLKYQTSQKAYLTTFPQGDNIQFSIAAHWGLHFDPRDPAQDPYDTETWVYSENAACQLLSYFIRFRAFDWDTQGEPTRAIIEAALDDCDVAQPLDAGGAEPRYRAAVVHKTTDEPAAIISEYLSAFDGWYCFNEQNHLILRSGRYYTPTVSLGPDKIVAYRDSGGTPVEDQINEIKITYISAEHDYADVEAKPWRDETAITASGREPNSTTLSVQSPSFTQNRRLAKRMMARINAEDKFTISTTYGGQEILGERYINLTITEGAYTGYSGPVEILTAPETDMQTGGLSFECCTVDPNIDAWNPATEDGYGAPVGDVIAREPVETPMIVSAIPELAPDGSSAQIDIVIDGYDIEGITWFARWQVTGTPVWNEQEYSDVDDGPSVTLITSLVPLNSSVDVQVLYRLPDGRYSDWSGTETVDTSTAALAPASPSGFTAMGGAGQVVLNWTNPVSEGFTDVRIYRNTTDNYGTATLVTTQTGSPGGLGTYTNSGLSAGTYYFFIIARNAVPVSSPPIASGAVTVV